MGNIKEARAGLTLIELIISIAVIGIIVIAFVPLFTMSAKTNNKVETTLSSTYLGKDAMELIYQFSKTVPYEDLGDKLIKKGYLKGEIKNAYNYEYGDKKYLNMKFTEKGNLVKVVVKIYKDKNMDRLEAQYESLYSWFGRGILSGEK